MTKKIFITGATGFIGSHLCEMSVKKGYEVIAFDRYNSNNDFGWLKDSKYLSHINLVLGDIRDYDSVYKSMKGCDYVFHLAALIGIPYSYVSPLAYLKTNVEGTYNVLESAKNLKINDIIITSTSEVYGSAKYLPIDEKHPLNAQSPYAASKVSADQLALSYYTSFDLPIKIIRPFNTFGPRQSARAVIPRIIIQCLNKKNKKLILGSTEPTRDFNFVEDTCEAYFEILKSKKSIGEVVNVGTNTNTSIQNLSKKIMNLTETKLRLIKSQKIVRPKLSEVDNLQCDNKKIKKYTKWKSKTNLDNGLKKTIKWIENNFSKYSDKYII